MNIFLLLLYIVNLIHNSHGKNPTVKTNFTWPLKPDTFYDIKLENNVGANPVVIFKTDKFHGCHRLKSHSKNRNMDGMRFKISNNLDITKEFAGRISFKSKYNRQLFQIHYMETLSCSSCKECVKETNGETLIYEHRIEMAKKYANINLKVQVYFQAKVTSNKKNFDANSLMHVSCIGIDGLSSMDPILTVGDGKNEFNEAKLIKNPAKLTDFSIFKEANLLKEYHNKELRCYIPDLNQSKVYKLTVNHPPTETELSTQYDGFIENGTSVKCSSKDGYPKSEASWSLQSLPPGLIDNQVYKISPNNTLNIHKNAPRDAKMTFRCNLKYTRAVGGYTYVHRDYEFTIGENPEKLDIEQPKDVTKSLTEIYGRLSKAVIGASIAGCIVFIIAIVIVFMVCRSKPKNSASRKHFDTLQADANKEHLRFHTPHDRVDMGDFHGDNIDDGTNRYAGSLIVGSKSQIKNQMNNQNGSTSPNLNDYNYDDMPRGRRPIKVVDNSEQSQKADPVVYSTIVGTMQPKNRPSLDIGPIDRV